MMQSGDDAGKGGALGEEKQEDYDDSNGKMTVDTEKNDMEKSLNSDETEEEEELEDEAPWNERFWEVVTTFWPLGFVAFGGPQAHVAILRDHLVVQRNWMDEEQFTELFAIGQGIPGPTSTQLVVSTATSRAGPLGGLVAFFLWTLPGLVILTVCGVLIETFVDQDNAPFYLIGLPPAATSLVFKAFYGFSTKLDKLGIFLSMCSGIVAILINGDYNIDVKVSQWVYPTMLAVGGLVTYTDSRREKPFSEYTKSKKGWDVQSDRLMKRIGIPLWVGAAIAGVWLFLLVSCILLVDVFKVENTYLGIFEVMYRIGSIIFGGGQVVLPMLQGEVVPQWMTKDQFFQGLGLSQSMPGPLFNFSAYLGAVHQGVPGALVAYVGLFGPGVILIFAMVPYWAWLRHVPWFRSGLQGVNATAIGLVGAACIILWEAAVLTAADAIVFVFAGTLACVFNVQAPLVILAGGILGAILCDDALSLGQVPYHCK